MDAGHRRNALALVLSWREMILYFEAQGLNEAFVIRAIGKEKGGSKY